MAALVASPTPQWHAVVCCDDDHGSSSKPRQGATMTDTASLSSSAPSSFTDSSTSSGSMEKQKKCPSPCPFETYCCLDEHCAPDCAAAARAAECKADNCAEACFDPTCDDGCEAECCDDPECEPEWCPEGCTIEEYVSRSVDVQTDCSWRAVLLSAMMPTLSVCCPQVPHRCRPLHTWISSLRHSLDRLPHNLISLHNLRLLWRLHPHLQWPAMCATGKTATGRLKLCRSC